jgi:hypothetical protein
VPASICDVLPSAAALLGVPQATDALHLAEYTGDVRRVVVLLVDGMGWHLLPELASSAPLLASVLAGGTGRLDELVCTFPSTTPTSLASLGTGAAPGQHGLLGFTVNVPGSARVLAHIYWRDDPPPAEWQPVPTWFERLRQAGVDARAVLPTPFIGSGLTESAYRGAQFCAAGYDEDYAAVVNEQVRMTTGLAYTYTSALDTAAHLFGVGSAEWHAAGAYVDGLLTRLLESLPSDAALLVTADHGGLNVNERIDLDDDPRLSFGVRVVAGEPRVRYLHTEPGAAHDVIAVWTELMADRADVLSRDDAVAAGLFGPVRPEHLARIGDVVVICHSDIALLASRHEPQEVAQLVGLHGGMTPAEMAIPLITFRG